MTLELQPIPSVEWKREFDALMCDEYLRYKYNRQDRLRDKIKYIVQFCDELCNVTNKTVIDIGTGPGEFLEILHSTYKHNIIGIDASPDKTEMGYKYGRLSELLTSRQNIPMKYDIDFCQLSFDDNSIYFINCQGAIEQIFYKHLTGPRHIETMNANLLSWNITDEFEEIFFKFLCECYRVLEVNGVLLIYGNGAKNVEEYDKLFKKCISQIDGFEIIMSFDYKFHKARKEK